MIVIRLLLLLLFIVLLSGRFGFLGFLAFLPLFAFLLLYEELDLAFLGHDEVGLDDLIGDGVAANEDTNLIALPDASVPDTRTWMLHQNAFLDTTSNGLAHRESRDVGSAPELKLVTRISNEGAIDGITDSLSDQSPREHVRL